MNPFTKIFLGIGAAAGIGYLLKMRRTSAEIETVATARIHQLDLKGCVIRVDLKIKNPTDGSLKIKFPFVKIIYLDKVNDKEGYIERTIGSSRPIDKNIQIPEFGEANIEAIMIEIPMSNLITIGGNLLSRLLKGNEIKMQIKTISAIELPFKSVPVEQKQEVVLKK